MFVSLIYVVTYIPEYNAEARVSNAETGIKKLEESIHALANVERVSCFIVQQSSTLNT